MGFQEKAQPEDMAISRKRRPVRATSRIRNGGQVLLGEGDGCVWMYSWFKRPGQTNGPGPDTGPDADDADDCGARTGPFPSHCHCPTTRYPDSEDILLFGWNTLNRIGRIHFTDWGIGILRALRQRPSKAEFSSKTIARKSENYPHRVLTPVVCLP